MAEDENVTLYNNKSISSLPRFVFIKAIFVISPFTVKMSGWSVKKNFKVQGFMCKMPQSQGGYAFYFSNIMMNEHPSKNHPSIIIPSSNKMQPLSLTCNLRPRRTETLITDGLQLNQAIPRNLRNSPLLQHSPHHLHIIPSPRRRINIRQ